MKYFCTTILLNTFLYLSVVFTQDNGSIFYHVSVEENGLTGTPTSFGVIQNYPNPFNHSTKIVYSVEEASIVRIVIYNILGREVQILADGFKAAGNYELIFNAENLPVVYTSIHLEQAQSELQRK